VVRDEYLAGEKYLSFGSFTTPIQVTVVSWACGSSMDYLEGSSIEFLFGHFFSGRGKKVTTARCDRGY